MPYTHNFNNSQEPEQTEDTEIPEQDIKWQQRQ